MQGIHFLANYYRGAIRALKQELPLIPGEVLPARVHTRHDARHYDLQIRGLRVAVESDIALKTGDRLQLRVARTGNPVILKLIPRTTTEGQKNETLNLDQVRQQLLRQALPKQMPLQKVFKQLLALPQSRTTGNTPFPEPVYRIINEFRQLVQSNDQPTTARQVRQAFETSGLFLESRLAGLQAATSHNPVLLRDIKALLFQSWYTCENVTSQLEALPEPKRVQRQFKTMERTFKKNCL
ncbi:MAG: hypothetical protein MI673_09700 [Thiotrichales bacterium]|nr:hypothetical protein [Thiotrichales bacterium]